MVKDLAAATEEIKVLEGKPGAAGQLGVVSHSNR